MDNEPSRQLKSRRESSLPCRTRSYASARAGQLRARGIVNRAAHSAAWSKFGICSIDDGINLQSGDIDERRDECHVGCGTVSA